MRLVKMKLFKLTGVFWILVVASCSTHTSELERVIYKTAQEQSVGLEGAETIFYGVGRVESPKWLELTDAEMLVEVDVEFDNFKKGFDLDDIEILDGYSGENFGSGPLVTYESEEDEKAKEFGTGPTRVTLLYVVPISTSSVDFVYWGKNLNSQPLTIKNMK